MRSILVILTIFAISPSIAYSQFTYYEVYDTGISPIVTYGQTNGLVAILGENPNLGSGSHALPNPLAVTSILKYEIANGRMDTNITNNGTQITRSLDISNLALVSEIYNNPTIPLTITPFTLSELAHIGGFDHFNYYQTITHLPSGVNAYLYDTLAPSVTPINTPIIDPVLNSSRYEYEFLSNISNTYIFVQNPYATDTNQSYYNDISNNELNYLNFTTSNSIEFIDAPRLPSGIMQPGMAGGYLGFSTDLVGVNADGSINTTWSNIGTNMNWRSNTYYTDTTVGGHVQFDGYTANPLSQGPTPSGGGIFGVGIDGVASVPEPRSLMLLTLGCLIILPIVISKKIASFS